MADIKTQTIPPNLLEQMHAVMTHPGFPAFVQAAYSHLNPPQQTPVVNAAGQPVAGFGGVTALNTPPAITVQPAIPPSPLPSGYDARLQQLQNMERDRLENPLGR